MVLIMAENTAFYVRAALPELGISEPFVKDLKVLLSLPEEVLHQVGEELANYPGFLSSRIQKDIISNNPNILSKDVALKLAEIVRFGEAYLRRNKGDNILLGDLDDWQRGPENRDPEVLTREELDRLKMLLPVIIREYPGRLRQSKAVQLSEATGLRVESIDLICDLRPILDETRSQVEGVIPLTTLKIVASGVDRFPISFEAILSAKDVQELLRTAERAISKLNALGEFAAQRDLRIPAVDLTETDE